jgi:hypothetical protein
MSVYMYVTTREPLDGFYDIWHWRVLLKFLFRLDTSNWHLTRSHMRFCALNEWVGGNPSGVGKLQPARKLRGEIHCYDVITQSDTLPKWRSLNPDNWHHWRHSKRSKINPRIGSRMITLAVYFLTCLIKLFPVPNDAMTTVFARV